MIILYLPMAVNAGSHRRGTLEVGARRRRPKPGVANRCQPHESGFLTETRILAVHFSWECGWLSRQRLLTKQSLRFRSWRGWKMGPLLSDWTSL